MTEFEIPESVYVDAAREHRCASDVVTWPSFRRAVESAWHSRDAEVAELTKARNEAEWRQKRCHHHHVESDVELKAALARVAELEQYIDDRDDEIGRIDLTVDAMATVAADNSDKADVLAAEVALKRENRRRAELNEAAAKGRVSEDPAERAKWLARDEAFTRGFTSPDGGL